MYVLLNPFINIRGIYSIDSLVDTVKSAPSTYISNNYSQESFFPNISPLSPEDIPTTQTHEYSTIVQTYTATPSNSWLDFVFDKWWIIKNIISGLLLFWIIISNASFYIKCRKERVFYSIDENTNLMIYTLPGIETPFLMGKAIYIDSSYISDENTLSHMVTHEYSHYKHFDYIWVPLKNLLLAMNWFNPFMWLANVYIKRDCELACDETALTILGESSSKSYALTLLNLANNQRRKNFIANATTSMSSSARRLKERIESITLSAKKSIPITIIVGLAMIAITCCTFIKSNAATIFSPSENQTNTQNVSIDSSESTSDSLSNVQTALSEDTSDSYDNHSYPIADEYVSSINGNNYYNSVKFANGYLFYSDLEGIKQVDNSLTKTEIIGSGNAKLGNYCDGYLYYIRYPENDTSGVYRLNCNNRTEEKILSWSDEMWLCQNIYASDSKVYIEYSNKCEVYEISDNAFNYTFESDFNTALHRCGLDTKNIIDFPAGYTNAYCLYKKIILFDRNQHGLKVFDANSGDILFELFNVLSDVLVTDHGLIYKDTSENIFYYGWNSSETKMIYNIVDNGGKSINYGTFDSDSMYGFIEEDQKCELLKISISTGEQQEIKTFDTTEKSIALGLSVNNKVVSYWQGGNIIFFIN